MVCMKREINNLTKRSKKQNHLSSQRCQDIKGENNYKFEMKRNEKVVVLNP